MSQCIFCDSVNGLNTSMTIVIDENNKIVVKICDTHADEATVKSAREAYINRKKKIDEVIAQAKSLGLHVIENPNGIAVVTSPLSPSQTNIQKVPIIKSLNANDANVIPTSRLDHEQFTAAGVSNIPDAPAYSGHDLNSLSDKLPDNVRDGFAKMAIVEGRGGNPITIPQRRTDSTGTTNITIIKSENDVSLQNRFKKMAQESMGDRTPDFAKQGYQNVQRQCPVCRGTGSIIQQKIENTCPKCNGSGIISVY